MRNNLSTIFNSLSSPITLPKPIVNPHWKKSLKKKKKNKKRRHKKPKPFKVPKYKEYIKSHQWRKRRNEYYRTHPKECVVCKSTRMIGLHHMTYKNLGRELDEDLVALCWPCHERYHEEYSKGNIYEQTQEYIIENQQVEEFSQIVKNL